jgi:hypothetical protein
MDDILERLLINRKLYDPAALFNDRKDEILENDDLLANIAGLAENSLPALTAVIKSRVAELSRQIVFEIHPAELMVYRQALVELDEVLNSVSKYAEEWKKREEAKKPQPKPADTGETQTPEAQTGVAL